MPRPSTAHLPTTKIAKRIVNLPIKEKLQMSTSRLRWGGASVLGGGDSVLGAGARVLGAALAVAIAAAVSAGPAFAHEQRQVDAYQFTVGWQHEPAYVGVPNAVQIFIDNADGVPVDDIGSPPSLRVTVATGNEATDPLGLRPSFDPSTGLGTHGEFDAALIPTAAGTYTFHITGTLGDQAVDETFRSSGQTFADVQNPSQVEFPSKLPATADLATHLSRLDQEVEKALRVGGKAHDKAASAGTLALIALIVGLAGAILGVTRRRRRFL